MIPFLFCDKPQESRTSLLNSLGKPIRLASLGMLDGIYPKGEGFPRDVLFTSLVQDRPRDSRGFSFRIVACNF